jgi:flagellar hook-associated protein 2
MPAIRMTGMASGLPPNIVETILEAERIPIKNQEGNREKIQSRLKLVQDLETKISDIDKSISELVGTRGFMNNKLISGDPNVVTGSADPEAPVTGSWNIEVLQLPQKASAVTNGFPDRDTTEVGVGYIKFETPEGSKEVYISGKDTTLDGVAKAVNQSGLGVRASVITDRADKENPFKLLIAGLSTGDEKQVIFPTVYMLDGDQDLYFDQTKAAQNGRIKVDGFEFEVSENTIRDIIPGVTLELRQAAPGREITISVKEDYEVIVGKIEEFVKATNGVLSFIQQQNNVNEKTDTSKTLGGDSLLRSIESRLRNLAQTPLYGIEGPVKRLSEIGISFQRNGVLQFDKKKLDSMLAKNAKDVGTFLAGDGFTVGFIPTLRREISNFTNQAFGPLANRKKGLQDKINSINKSIENKERALGRKEEALRRQFANLEEKMSKLQQQGAAVAAIGGGGGGGMPKLGPG